MFRRTAILAASLVPLAVACGSTPGARSGADARVQGSVTVFAAASLTSAFEALGKAFERQHGGTSVKFNFAGTPTLVTQIEQGARADVFASADTANLDKLKTAGFATGTPEVFAHNRLEIVVARGNPKRIHSLADLAKPGVIYISEAATVPAGRYALQALTKAGVSVTPRSLEPDVKSVVSKVELGEADAGIVYTTDVKAAAGRVDGVSIPDLDNVAATYPIVMVKGAENPSAARAFIAFVLSPAGQSMLASYGFERA